MNDSIIEIYEKDKDSYMLRLNSSFRFNKGDLININQKTWKVVKVTFAVDHSASMFPVARCNVDVVEF